MTFDLHGYLRDQACTALVLEKDIAQLTNYMLGEAKNPRLKNALQHQHDAVQFEISNLEQVINKLGLVETSQQGGGFFVEVGEALGFEPGKDKAGMCEVKDYVGQSLISEHRSLLDGNPSDLEIDLQDTFDLERLVHLDIANLTNLIVLAKQLGEFEVANLLQQNIDCEVQTRSIVESELPMIVSDIGGASQGKMAA